MTKATACLIALAVAGLAAPASAAETKLTAHLGGAGSADTDGAGHANFRVDAEKNQICYDLMVEKIADATMAHIHKGAAGASGPVAVPLTTRSRDRPKFFIARTVPAMFTGSWVSQRTTTMPSSALRPGAARAAAGSEVT